MATRWGIPKKIRITTRISYEVRFVRLSDDTLGECCGEDRVIYIRTGMSWKMTVLTLIHEILHCIEYEFDFDLPHRTIYKMEKALFDILKLNYWI